MNRLKKILFIIFLFCIAHFVKAEILSNGGGDASSTNFQVTACIGETIIGLAGSASSSISCGFLVGLTATEIVCECSSPGQVSVHYLIINQ